MNPRRTQERAIEWVMRAVAISAFVALVLLVGFVAVNALTPPQAERSMLTSKLVVPTRAQHSGGRQYVWQPVGFPPKFNLVPLLFGTAKLSLLALGFALPVALAAAVFTARMCRARTARAIRFVIDLLAGVPSVVFGFFALAFLASWVHATLGGTYRLNTLVAALALALAVVPVVFGVALDALRGVPRPLEEASIALGAQRWQTLLRVTIPTALPGIAAAALLALGRCVGETMIVLMASGNAAVISLSPTTSARTVTATLASEFGEAPRRSAHWQVLFLLALVLLCGTLVLDAITTRVMHRLRARYGTGDGR